jgi:hypothetical protein
MRVTEGRSESREALACMKLFALVSLGVLTANASLGAQTTDSPLVAGSMFSTLGDQIVEQNQKPVRLACSTT